MRALRSGRTLSPAWLLTFALLLTSWPAAAQGWRELDVAVLPVVHVGATGDDLFAERPEIARLRAAAARWQRGLEEALASRDLVRAGGYAELRARLRGAGDFARTSDLANERYALGLERWRALAPQEALTQLDRARELHLEAFADLLDPRALGDVDFHRALTLMDLGRAGEAHNAFAAMLLRDPARRFQSGYYGGPTEAAMRTAAREVLEIPDMLAVLWPTDRLLALGKKLGVDVFAVGVVTGEEARAVLTVGLFDVRVGGFAQRERFVLSDGELISEDIDRFVAAWHTCALEAERPLVAPRARRRWAVEVGYTHAVWIQHKRTRDLLQGPGVTIGVSYEATPGLEIWARTSQRVTLTDAKGDLLGVFTTSHLALGVGLVVGEETWRFSVRSGLDLGVSLADLTTTTDVNCKFFGPESDRCRSLYRAESPAMWLGLDFAMALRFAPTRAWHLGLTVGATSYALAGAIVGELNFPLYGTLAFGLPF